MSTEYGVWSDEAGGFIATQMYTPEEAEQERDRLITDGEDSKWIKVVEICPDHEEQPADACEECDDDSNPLEHSNVPAGAIAERLIGIVRVDPPEGC